MNYVNVKILSDNEQLNVAFGKRGAVRNFVIQREGEKKKKKKEDIIPVRGFGESVETRNPIMSKLHAKQLILLNFREDTQRCICQRKQHSPRARAIRRLFSTRRCRARARAHVLALIDANVGLAVALSCVR